MLVVNIIREVGAEMIESVLGPLTLDSLGPETFDKETTWIILQVRPHLQAGNLQEIVDPGLQSDYSLESMWKVIEVAMTSVEPKDSHRPNMQEVVQELREAAAIEEQRCAKLARPPRASDGQQGGRNSSSSEIRGDLFTDTSQESVGSRYSMPSPR